MKLRTADARVGALEGGLKRAEEQNRRFRAEAETARVTFLEVIQVLAGRGDPSLRQSRIVISPGCTGEIGDLSELLKQMCGDPPRSDDGRAPSEVGG